MACCRWVSAARMKEVVLSRSLSATKESTLARVDSETEKPGEGQRRHVERLHSTNIEPLKEKKIISKAKRERNKGKRGDSDAKKEKRDSPRFILCWRLKAMWGFSIVRKSVRKEAKGGEVGFPNATQRESSPPHTPQI